MSVVVRSASVISKQLTNRYIILLDLTMTSLESIYVIVS